MTTAYNREAEGLQAVERYDYPEKTWLSPDGEPHLVTNITSQAAKGSPIASVTYSFNDGAQHRQIFFYDTNGLIATTNATNDGAWSEVYNPWPKITKYPGAKGLAACVGTDDGGLKGMRVYLANDNGYIQEIGFDFDSSRSPSWNAWMPFDGSDREAGVACNIVGDTNHLYFRNKTTSLLHQWTWDYSDVNASWTAGPRSTNTPVVHGGSVATTSDGKSTEYLFFQSDGGNVVNGLFTGGSLSEFTEGVSTLNAASADYHLAAVWTDEATMLNQIAGGPNQLAFSMVSRDGEARNGTVAAT
jgi:hypothetical protein